MPDVLIVGAGPAGAACAETLREEGFTGSILLAGREPDPPYHRPPASKEYLRGERSREDCLLHPEDFWAQNDIDLRVRASVMKLDTAERTAKVGADVVSWNQALIATGSNVRRLRVDGAGLQGVHYLRTLGNSDSIRAEAREAESVVLVGGSYIACEVAATLTTMGCRCTMVMLEERPLAGPFGEVVGRHVEERLRSEGVEMVTADELAGFEGGGERVERVVTAAGVRVEADLVVMGTGAVPDVMLARSAGLELAEGGGVQCDAALLTSVPGLWAAGDVCEYESVTDGRRMRIEHWEVARAQGRHVARAMLGAREPFRDVPYFWSDLSDWLSLEYVGGPGPWDDLRVERAGSGFGVRYLAAGRLVGYLSVDGGGDLEAARRELAQAS